MKNNIYNDLGIKTVIHAAGTKSSFGGSRMSAAVIDAITEASKHFASIDAVNRKIGEYIAEITGAEAGMVTSGAASGVVLSMAACMTGTDINKVKKLPNSQGMRNKLIMQKIHMGSYSHMYTFPGVDIVEIGDFNDCLIEELEGAYDDNTAAVGYLFGPRVSQTGLTLSQIVTSAHKRDIPVIVDAAAMLPPKSNLRKYITEGADLVVFSGGKLIHGPQATGLMFGRKDLVDAAFANSNPNHSIGRPHKVSKEDMIGLYVALKQFMESDEEVMLENFKDKLTPIVDELSNINGVTVEIVHDGINYHVPVAIIKFHPSLEKIQAADFPKIMLRNEPAIFMQYFKELGHLVVNPISLQDGEPEIVAQELKKQILMRI
jgi:uncharacterized pyridoxal phosphate-dependent enzyme